VKICKQTYVQLDNVGYFNSNKYHTWK